jgi:hypothetical protein
MMKNLRIMAAASVLLGVAQVSYAQFEFANLNTKLSNANFNSGCSVTIADWNNDGLDDIIRLDQGRNAFVEIQKTGNQFETRSFGQMATSSAWAMCVADLDKNGYLDIIGGWNGSCKVIMINSDGVTSNLITLPSSNFFLQNITAVDANNDGWIDLFTCDDNGESTIYMNDGAGNLFVSNIIDFDVTNSDDSGNYGSVWTDFDNDGDLDLYIAKCRQGVNDPADGRRINVMFVNNGDGTYTEDAAEYGINVGWQSWTASFGDIDNDADLDLLLTNHDFESQIFENDGTGHYTDITASTGFDISDMTPIQSGFEDLDNDGFIDIVITGSTHRIFHNNGNSTFTEVTGLFDSNDIGTFAFGDLNHDGKIDLYTAYNQIYTTPTSIDDIIWLNKTANNNHFLTVELQGTISNKTAIGARARIYGPWGVQLREVRAGESYGTVSTSKLHFGLGEFTSIDSLVVDFPSGIHQSIINPAIDQFLTVIENTCVSPSSVVIVDGSEVICPGSQVLLTAPAGYTYLWSDNSTAQALTVTATGEYNVLISEPGNPCSVISRTITIIESPDETPTIEALGQTEFCSGGSVEISGPAGLSGYQWSNGANSQTISVSEAGNYTLTIQGACAEFTSEPVSVSVLSPISPIVEDTAIPNPGTITLSAIGENLTWYSDAAGTTVVGTGNDIESPFVNENTTFYVSSALITGGDDFNAGLFAHTGTSVYSGSNNTNASLFFDVFENCTLKSVKVDTDTPGNRTIEVRDANGTVLQSATFTLVVGEQILNLNFELTPGVDYSLGTNGATNQASLGFASPRLKRNYAGNGGTPYAYPFNAGELLSITSSSAGDLYFFYFYNWEVESELVECNSDLVPLNVTVDEPSLVSSQIQNNLSIYPNPASETVMIQDGNPGVLSVMDASGRLVKQLQIQGNAQVSVADLDAGVYLLQHASKVETKMVKLIVE